VQVKALKNHKILVLLDLIVFFQLQIKNLMELQKKELLLSTPLMKKQKQNFFLHPLMQQK
jgi:hypothetical protein